MGNGSDSLGRGSKHFLRNIWSVLWSCKASLRKSHILASVFAPFAWATGYWNPVLLTAIPRSQSHVYVLSPSSAVSYLPWALGTRVTSYSQSSKTSAVAYCVSRRAFGALFNLRGCHPYRFTTYPTRLLFIAYFQSLFHPQYSSTSKLYFLWSTRPFSCHGAVVAHVISVSYHMVKKRGTKGGKRRERKRTETEKRGKKKM